MSEYSEIRNREILDEFLLHLRDYYNIAHKTYETYEQTFRVHIFPYLNQHNLTIHDVTRVEILDLDRKLREKKMQENTARAYMKHLKMVLKYLCAIGEIPSVPWPPMVKVLRKEERHTKLVLSSDQIYRARRLIGRMSKHVERGAMFEALISSGMRINELLQIRVCDLNFRYLVEDTELGYKSPYVGCSIYLDNTKFLIKKRFSRRVYLSVLATKLIKAHLRYYQLSGDMPIFPWKRQGADTWLKKYMLPICRENNPTVKEIAKPRVTGFRDVKVDNLPVSNKFKRLIKRRQADQEKLGNQEVVTNFVKRPKKVQLHFHAMRHTFTAIMYYRNYFGRRMDYIGLKDFLGHQSFKTTDVYLTQVNILKGDQDWRNIMLGRPMDYVLFLK